MTDTNANARFAAQRAILDNVIGDDGVDSLRTLARTTDAIKAVVLKEIGRLYVSSEDAQADELRMAFYSLESLQDLANRVCDEHDLLEARAP